MVVGAGMTGLTVARALSGAPGSADVVVLDAARGVGGRMATRRIGPAVLDHGAQFITTHTLGFAEQVGRWQQDGAVAPWFTGRVGPWGVSPTDRDGHTRYRGAPSMTAVAKHLAGGVDVRLGVRAGAVRVTADGWRVETADGALAADAVVLTTPVPQALDLLSAGGVPLGDEDAAALAAVRYDPCIAVLAVLDDPADLPEPGAVAPDQGVVDWVADNRAKGISPVPALTVHAAADLSRAAWDVADDEVADRLLSATGVRGRVRPGAVQVHRWRYARPTVLHPRQHLAVEHPGRGGPLVLAGDAFDGPKVEGAYLSGAAAARHLGRAAEGTMG